MPRKDGGTQEIQVSLVLTRGMNSNTFMLSVEDTDAGVEFVSIELTVPEFADLLSARSLRVEAPATVRLARVGMRHCVESRVVPIPLGASKELALEILAAHTREGEIPDVSCATNRHKSVLGGQMIPFHRWETKS